MGFKETEVGRIPEEWEVAELKDISEYRKDRIKLSEINIYNYISTENMKPNREGVTISSNIPLSKTVSKYLKDDILISNIRPYFKKIWFANKSGGSSNDVLVIKSTDKNKVNNKYLYYSLMEDDFFDYVTLTSKGTKMPRGDKEAIMKYKINIPPLKEQKAIAQILSTLDEKIETNNKINKNLETMASEIFKHWFVDFEFPDENGNPYKSSGGVMVESKMGLIPEGWEVNSLDGIAEYLNGLAMQKFRPSEKEGSYPVLKIKELRQGSTDNTSDRCSKNIEERYIVNDGDIIFSWSGSLLVDIWCGGKCGLNQHLFKITSENHEIWLYYHWTKYYLEKFIEIAKGKATTMGHIKRKDLSDSKVLIPNNDMYNDFDMLFKLLYEKIVAVKIESKKLIELRNILLPKLISGKIRVPLDD